LLLEEPQLGLRPARVALVVDKASGDLHGDGPLLMAAFRKLAVEAEIVPWGAGPDWGSFDGVLIRHTWDYIFERDSFLAWAEDVSERTRLANSAEVLRWNTDKRYLREIEAAGIPIVPTAWVAPGEDVPEVEWESFIVKPSVSAGARLSARYLRGDDIASHVERIHMSGAAAMLQPYVTTVDDEGETGTYVFGGEVSHAIRKGPVLNTIHSPRDDLSAASHQRVGPAPVEPTLAAFGLRVLQRAPAVLYARVDTVIDREGHPMLMELEVTEPFLFLEHAPEAADRFARAVSQWLSG
jgi:hypothetical protein